MSKTDGFYMVWNPNGSVPTHRHATHKMAMQEAERILRQSSTKQIFVLKAITEVVRKDIESNPLETIDDIPF